MAITVNLQSGVPIEDQLCAQLREQIVTGRLSDGQPLPSTRQLGADLAVHFNTVARAYRRLQIEGLLVVAHGRGVFVKASPARAPRPSRDAHHELKRRLRQIFVEARLGGFTRAQAGALVQREIEDVFQEETRR